MNWAHLDDGRLILVDSSRQQTRNVGGKDFFLSLNYVNVLLEGSWQVVKKDRLRPAEFGSPFTVLKS